MTRELHVHSNQYERQWANSSRLKSIIALTHPRAVIIFSVTTLILAFIAERGLQDLFSLLCLSMAMIFAQATVGLINEIVDSDLDAVAKPWRAIPAGYICIQAATILALACCVVGLIFAYLLSFSSMLILAAGMGVGILYSVKLKRTVLSWIAYALAYPSVPVWVWISLGKYESRILLIYFLAIPFTLGIHLVNQMRDYDDDAAMGVKSLVHYLGKSRAAALSYFLLLLCPVPLLVIVGTSNVNGALLLTLAAILHWTLIIPTVWSARIESNPAVFRKLFRRLQLTGPLTLLSWLLSIY